ncbi:MAG: hypothetical protein ACSLE8_12595 [Rhodococcus sp. (in: high G+C Gram-positive bacteria)]
MNRIAGASSIHRRSSALRLVVLTAVLSALLVAVPGRADAVAPTLDLRVLLVSADGTEPAFAAWQAQLTAEGVPFDALVAETAPPITGDQLVMGPDHARYQAVVLASPDLVACDATNGCASTVSSEELAALAEFERTFGVRQVDAYAYPSPALGLSFPSSGGELDGVVAAVTPAGSAVFPYLSGSVPIEDAWGYLATPAPGEGETFENLVAAPTGEPLVGALRRGDGREEMVVTVDTNPWTMHSRLLLHGMLRWVTRGIYLGFSRNHLSVHIDDVFLPDDRWDIDDNMTHEDDGATNPLIRMDDDDAEFLRSWQQKNGMRLDLTFNGAGSDEFVATNGADPLAQVLVANRGEFRWLNHTFSHPNLDNAGQPQIQVEIKDNRDWAKKKKIAITANELVTGEHSGLANPAMPAALDKTKITWVASDNSRTPQQQALGKALTVPRHPTNIYYNTATRAEQLDEYNYLYGEGCVPSPVTTCLTEPITWDRYVDREAAIMLGHMLTNDVRPHYVHQANLAEDRVLYDVLDKALDRYRGAVSIPLVQPTLTDAGRALARQAAWRNALANGQVTASITGTVVTITSAVNLDVPTTAGAGSTVTTKVKKRGRVKATPFGEQYGGSRSAWTTLGAGKTLTLNVAA